MEYDGNEYNAEYHKGDTQIAESEMEYIWNIIEELEKEAKEIGADEIEFIEDIKEKAKDIKKNDSI
jgi:hypothetical protein